MLFNHRFEETNLLYLDFLQAREFLSQAIYPAKLMKSLGTVLLCGLLALGTASCSGVAKTSSAAPNSTSDNPSNIDKSTAQNNQNNSTSELRRKQLNSDIRAHEQRNKVGEDKGQRTDDDIKSEVRSKLQANLPAAALAIDAKNGAVTIAGTVVDQNQLNKITPLTEEIPGVKSVTVNTKIVASAKPAPPASGTEVPLKDHTGK